MPKGVIVRIHHVTDETVADIGPEDIGKAVASGDGLVWVDFDHTDESGMAMLPDLFDVHSADVADCHIRTPVPKLHRYPDHHYTAINGLARGADGRLYFVPLKVFQHPGLVVTVLGPTSTALPDDAARTEISVVHQRIGADGFRPTTSLQLITAIRRAMMATLEILVGEAAGRIADFEKRCAAKDPVPPSGCSTSCSPCGTTCRPSERARRRRFRPIPGSWSLRKRTACWASTSGVCAICARDSANSCRPSIWNANTSRK